MELENLGFDGWFQDRLGELHKPGRVAARLTAVNRDGYLVRNEVREVPAELAGSFVFSTEPGTGFPAVGDWAMVQYHNSDTLAIIHDLFPRRSSLRRKTPGRKIDYQLIASNIDTALIIQSCDFDFNIRRLERYLVMVNEGSIEPVVLLTKTDLVGPGKPEEMISWLKRSNIECRMAAISNKTGLGLDRVRGMLEPGKTYCLLGSSGVGKTTLLNHLLGRDTFETRATREKDGKGRHTTARRQLVLMDGGAMIIDTPGMRELGSIGAGTGIEESFSEIRELTGSCRFTDCSHTGEPGCALREAVERGELSQERYRSYLKLVKESEYHQMSYLDKRRKDRKFGQLIKSVKKHSRKRQTKKG
jgi:ribosome biogenesis GTPase